MDDKCASVFAYHLNDPKRYGVIEFNENNKVLSIDEKPIKPKSNYYFQRGIANYASGNYSKAISDLSIVINKEKTSLKFWATSSLMAPFYEILNTTAKWLTKKGLRKKDSQKYVSSLFLALY